MNRELFRQIRLYQGMTQIEFAAFLGISYSLVAMIEAGHKGISPKTKYLLASKVELSDDFFVFVEKMNRLSQ